MTRELDVAHRKLRDLWPGICYRISPEADRGAPDWILSYKHTTFYAELKSVIIPTHAVGITDQQIITLNRISEHEYSRVLLYVLRLDQWFLIRPPFTKPMKAVNGEIVNLMKGDLI